MVAFIILGLVQGLTEFLPISSSAHIIFLQEIFGLKSADLLLNVLVHFATILALCLYFFRDIIALFKKRRLLLLLIIATIPTVVIALATKTYVEQLFSETIYPAVFIFVTGLILYLSQKYSKEKKNENSFSIIEASIVGIVQGIAILPGISRAGITIATGMFLGWNRAEAAKFSFLLAIPIIFGATLYELMALDNVTTFINPNYIVSMVCAFFSGLFALWLLLNSVKKSKLHIFSYYCWLIGTVFLIFSPK